PQRPSLRRHRRTPGHHAGPRAEAPQGTLRTDLDLRPGRHGLRDGARAMTAPLEGLRVIDLTRYIPGPYCAMLLGDLGADVVKVEEPPFGDPTRALPPAFGEDSAAHAALNRNKRSLAVDLRTAEGVEVVRRLAARADVFLEAFRPGALARRGLGPEPLLAETPRLVHCSLTGCCPEGAHSPR